MGDFRGTLCHTAAWPVDLDVRDKRVGLIGTGFTGKQVITAIAGQVKRLTCFQRRRARQRLSPRQDQSRL
ncbi:hypothetical protein BDBG_16890 [Blastomyces gilchristii SLH14081]|uniref:Uncharacterized protein n=2 Tax=Blastomyces TaxID=229219 RepID=A0A179UMW5_BLAGS|nr:uncharacterized protein BDBG_16890 [Blastomyces gilchristii SLH14081]EGE79777.2 hypothetical protein BDDG_02718 [Blastomyces dermatitidis ATCC 18188]OAT07752.1 hypothetical protein BDBG_16890 [Blastomyces gilchristii SLH14081]